MRRPSTVAGALLTLALCTTASAVTAQRHPIPPGAGGCRSELDARLAFGLCPDSTFDFYAAGPYRPGIPRPEQVLGYPIGSWHTTYGRMERYIAELARTAPERVRVFDYGRSNEHQVMHLVAISGEGNIGRLEEIRTDLQRLADPRRTTQADAEALVARLPIVVWLNAANDGNETAAFEAAIQAAYQLAAGEDERTKSLREGAVVLINLAHNPESHERMVHWYNAFVMGDADPFALEHDAPWGMSTNNNHYQFDLNRDALGLTQTETRAVAAELQRWRPQVFVDLHGETTQYFFPPSAIPVNPVLPEQTEKWLEEFGRGNAAAFDPFGWSYYTRDVFDLYYPGYWDSYPALHGATGMTYETDGGGQKGVRWRRGDGTILTFADGIAHHFVAALATVETALKNRPARLRDYFDYFRGAMERARRGTLRTVVLLPATNPEGAHRLATTLLRHGIEVSRVTRGGTLAGTDYLSGRRESRTVPAGAYVIDLVQPNARLAETLLAPDVPLPRRFAEQELGRLLRNIRRAESEKEGFEFYDVTAWSLPLALGVDALWTGTAHDLGVEPVRISDDVARATGGWASEAGWPREGGVSARARSAYLWAAGGEGPTRLMARLIDEGFNVAIAQRPVGVADTTFPRGAFIARVGRNPARLHERIDALAREAGVRVYAAQTAFQERGPTGTGSEWTRSLVAPRVAVLSGEGVGISSYGALWFQLERRIGYPFTALRAVDLPRMNIDRFDVIVLPDGRGYGGALGERGVSRLKDWIDRGGTLIGYGAAADYLQNQDLGAEFVPMDTARPPEDTLAAIRREIERAAPRDLTVPPTESPGARPEEPLPVPGALVRVRLDRTHWLTFGYEQDELAVLMGHLPIRPTSGGANPVTFAPADRLVAAGFTWPGVTTRAYPGRPFATVDNLGAGKLILLAADPLFRGVFTAPSQLLMNAIFLGARGRPGAE